MPVYKDEKTNTWYVKSRYKDWTGKSKHLMKRGFALKREAVDWEAAFFQRQDASLDMSFADFYQIYKEDISSRLKASTWDTKEAIIEKKILPFFKNLRMRDITSVDVIRWHTLFADLVEDAAQPVERHLQPRCPLLQAGRKPGPSCRFHR